MFKHCTILYGTCQDSDDGVNFQSEYWRKLVPSDFVSFSVMKHHEMSSSLQPDTLNMRPTASRTKDIPNVGASTCNGTMLTCSEDGTDPWPKLRREHGTVLEVGPAHCASKDPCEAFDGCLKMYHGCGGKLVQCSLDAP